MDLFDVTVPIRNGMPVYEGDPAVDIRLTGSVASGDIYNFSTLSFGLHTGTHVDAPRHFIDGAPGVDELPFDALVGDAYVADLTSQTNDIDATALAGLEIPVGTKRLILKTRNSELWDLPRFSPSFIGMTVGAAKLLVERGVTLVGIDYLSIAPYSDPASTHITLLRAGVVILEGLDLRGVEEGSYQLVCLPLLVEGADGAPVRALLMRA